MKPTTTIGAGCLVIEDDHVLLVKPNYGAAKDHWILPGGFIEAGEVLADGALRELKEETGQIGMVRGPYCVRYRLSPSDIYWIFHVERKLKNSIQIQAEELIDAQFVALNEAVRSPTVRPMTRYFLECLRSADPCRVPLPHEFAQNNLVYFMRKGELSAE